MGIQDEMQGRSFPAHRDDPVFPFQPGAAPMPVDDRKKFLAISEIKGSVLLFSSVHPEEEAMKKCFLLLTVLLSLLSIAHAANQGLTVGSPYLATQWCKGNNLDIGWSRWGDWSKLDQDPDNLQVMILLVQVGVRAKPRVITTKAPAHQPRNKSVGKFNWPIPFDIAPGDYRVRVMTLNKLIKSESEVFVIKSCQQVVRLDTRAVKKPMDFALLNPGRIGGRVNGSTQSNLLAARKIRVLLKKGGALVRSTEYTLDAQGSANYQFALLPLGTYEVTVEKVATPMPAGALNVCFRGTVPAQRTVVIASGSTDFTGQDFAIQYDIAFDMHGLCW
jgi:hypothetical protein